FASLTETLLGEDRVSLLFDPLFPKCLFQCVDFPSQLSLSIKQKKYIAENQRPDYSESSQQIARIFHFVHLLN
ncbi:MAG: hypothetical protein V3V88_03315, partial [Dehalococcoidia bacterium]